MSNGKNLVEKKNIEINVCVYQKNNELGNENVTLNYEIDENKKLF